MASIFIDIISVITDAGYSGEDATELIEASSKHLLYKFTEYAPRMGTGEMLEMFRDALAISLDPVVETRKGKISKAFCILMRSHLKERLMLCDANQSIDLAIEALCAPELSYATLEPLRNALLVIRDGVNDQSAGLLPFENSDQPEKPTQKATSPPAENETAKAPAPKKRIAEFLRPGAMKRVISDIEDGKQITAKGFKGIYGEPLAKMKNRAKALKEYRGEILKLLRKIK